MVRPTGTHLLYMCSRWLNSIHDNSVRRFHIFAHTENGPVWGHLKKSIWCELLGYNRVVACCLCNLVFTD